MKVSVQKLGSIEHTEFELKPLTIFVGPNNSGKTWLAYTVASILSSYGWHKYVEAYVQSQLTENYPLLDEAVEKLIVKGNARVDIYKFAEKYGEEYFQNVAQHARSWIADYMSTQFPLFDEVSVSLSIGDEKKAFLERLKKLAVRRRSTGGVLTIQKKAGDNTIFMYTTTENDEQITEKLPPEAIKEQLARVVMNLLHHLPFNNVRIFPTERTMLVMFRKNEIRVQQRSAVGARERMQTILQVINDVLQEFQEFADTSLIQSIPQKGLMSTGMFLGMLNEISNVTARNLEKRKKDSVQRKYIELAELLEKEILSGNVDFSTPDIDDPRREILFKPAENVNMEIKISSSMVKGLSSLVLYLRYLAQPGELIVIDEPEMNLHPAAQVEIIEFLGMLVNAGLHVLITTHSTYVVDHLMNLMTAYGHVYKQERTDEKKVEDVGENEAEDLDEKRAEDVDENGEEDLTENEKEIIEKFLLERKESFISPDKVAVYEMLLNGENGENMKSIHSNGLIDWATFSDVTRYVQRVNLEL